MGPRLYLLTVLACCSGLSLVKGQQQEAPTEFLRPTWPLELAQGSIGPHQAYAGTARLARMFLIVPGKLRIGPVAGGLLSDGKGSFIGGVRLAYCLKPFGADVFGTWGNLQARLEGQWCSEGFFVPGGGLEVEVGERVLLGVHGYITIDPDLDTNPGWLMTSLAFNLDKFFGHKKQTVPTDDTIPPIPVTP
jgi:hypothetical protein